MNWLTHVASLIFEEQSNITHVKDFKSTTKTKQKGIRRKQSKNNKTQVSELVWRIPRLFGCLSSGVLCARRMSRAIQGSDAKKTEQFYPQILSLFFLAPNPSGVLCARRMSRAIQGSDAKKTSVFGVCVCVCVCVCACVCA